MSGGRILTLVLLDLIGGTNLDNSPRHCNANTAIGTRAHVLEFVDYPRALTPRLAWHVASLAWHLLDGNSLAALLLL